VWRLGWTAGAGVETPFARIGPRVSNISIQATGSSVAIPAAGQRFDSDFSEQRCASA